MHRPLINHSTRARRPWPVAALAAVAVAIAAVLAACSTTDTPDDDGELERAVYLSVDVNALQPDTRAFKGKDPYNKDENRIDDITLLVYNGKEGMNSSYHYPSILAAWYFPHPRSKEEGMRTDTVRLDLKVPRDQINSNLRLVTLANMGDMTSLEGQKLMVLKEMVVQPGQDIITHADGSHTFPMVSSRNDTLKINYTDKQYTRSKPLKLTTRVQRLVARVDVGFGMNDWYYEKGGGFLIPFVHDSAGVYVQNRGTARGYFLTRSVTMKHIGSKGTYLIQRVEAAGYGDPRWFGAPDKPFRTATPLTFHPDTTVMHDEKVTLTNHKQEVIDADSIHFTSLGYFHEQTQADDDDLSIVPTLEIVGDYYSTEGTGRTLDGPGDLNPDLERMRKLDGEGRYSIPIIHSNSESQMHYALVRNNIYRLRILGVARGNLVCDFDVAPWDEIGHNEYPVTIKVDNN